MKKIVDDWFTVERIDPCTYAISEYGHWEKVHSFLLIGKSRALLIDTGLGIDNIRRITDQLTDLPIIVITTHVHCDHIGSHGQFDEFYVHEEEEDWITNGIKGLPIEVIRRDVSRDITIPVPGSFNPETYEPYRGTPAGLIKDGDIFHLGDREITVYHTPGHSPGHVCILDTTNGYLFSGDLLYKGTIYAFYPSTDPLQLIQSLERISEIVGVKKIFGSHHQLGFEPDIFIEVKEAIQYLRENHLVLHGSGVHHFKSFSVQF